MQDSGMSDSEFIKTQKLIQEKNAKSMAELEKGLADEAMRKRLSDAGNVVRKKTLWQKIKGWLK